MMPKANSKRQEKASLPSRVNDIMIHILSKVFESESALTMAAQNSELIPHIRLEKSPKEIVMDHMKLHEDLKMLQTFCQDLQKEIQSRLEKKEVSDFFYPSINHKDLNRLQESVLTKKAYILQTPSRSFAQIKKDLKLLLHEVLELEQWTAAALPRVERVKKIDS